MSNASSSHSSPMQAGATLHELRLIVLVFMALVAAFVLRQAWLQHQAVVASRTNVERLRAELAKMNSIRESFARYGGDHPGFVPILNKYGISAPGRPAPTVPGVPMR